MNVYCPNESTIILAARIFANLFSVTLTACISTELHHCFCILSTVVLLREMNLFRQLDQHQNKKCLDAVSFIAKYIYSVLQFVCLFSTQ